MKTKNIAEGLQTLAPYYEDPDGSNAGVDHGAVYGYSTHKPLSEPDVQKMIDLGWWQPVGKKDEDDEFVAKDYDPDESWWVLL